MQGGKFGLGRYIGSYSQFFFFVYGSWEPLDSLKILPRGVGTFSPIGQAIPRISKKRHCIYFPKPVDPQNFRSSISPNSRARGAGIHTKTCGTSNILERISSLFSTNSTSTAFSRVRRVVTQSPAGKALPTAGVPQVPSNSWYFSALFLILGAVQPKY